MEVDADVQVGLFRKYHTCSPPRLIRKEANEIKGLWKCSYITQTSLLLQNFQQGSKSNGIQHRFLGFAPAFWKTQNKKEMWLRHADDKYAHLFSEKLRSSHVATHIVSCVQNITLGMHTSSKRLSKY